MLRASWATCALPYKYASAWSDGSRAKLIEGDSEADVEAPWLRKNATAAELRAFLETHREHLQTRQRDLFLALRQALASTEFLEGAVKALRAAEEAGAITIVGSAGRGTRRIRLDEVSRSWYDVRMDAGYLRLEDAVIAVVWEMPGGTLTLYPGDDRGRPHPVTWAGLPLD